MNRHQTEPTGTVFRKQLVWPICYSGGSKIYELYRSRWVRKLLHMIQ